MAPVDTPYDLNSVSRTYQRRGFTIDKFVAEQVDLVALNINLLRRARRFVQAVDFGCGAGGFYHQLGKRLIRGDDLAAFRYRGIDASATQIAAAQRDFMESESLIFRQGSALETGLPGGFADICFECRLMQFLEQPLAALAEMIRVSRDLVVATVYTLPEPTPGFHPFFTGFTADRQNNLVDGGRVLHELNYAGLHKPLLRQTGATDAATGHTKYAYVFARQRRTIPSHDQFRDMLKRTGVRILYHHVIEAEFDNLADRPGIGTGPTDAGDRYQAITPQWHTMVLAVS